jgi:hypothetical protein
MNPYKRSAPQRKSVSKIDPRRPTEARPGSPEKIEVLRQRNASGLPLWHPQDRNDHGPRKPDSQEFAA